MKNYWSRYSLILSGSLALFAFGCGDDDGGGDRPDARPQADSSPDDPDAGGGGLLRSGTIAVTEAALTNPGLDTFSGALVRVDFSDATTGNAPAPVAGFDSNINNCLIRIWDVGTHEGSDAVDEGAVSVTGNEANGDFACGYNAAVGYACQSTTPAIAGGVAGNGETFVLTGTGDTLVMTGAQASAEMVGMYIVLTGFAPVPDGTRIPILAVNEETDTLTLFGVTDGLVVTGDANATFSTFVGIGPVPGGAQFLGGAADAFTVQKAAGGVVAAIDEDFEAQGQGFTLVDDDTMAQYLPHNIPFDGTEVNFECVDDGCGAVGSGGLIQAIVVNGETTDGALDGLDPSDPMPDPETQYATFQCSFIGSDVATLSADAMAAILGTSPTRIQTSVGRYRGAILEDDAGETSTIILQGHAFLGWADAPE